MMFSLQFDTDNAAFEDDNVGLECARILQDIAKQVGRGYQEGRVIDSNGNKVGTWELNP
jgi:hypothetical protein